MLAGRMKLTHFVALVSLVGVASAVLLVKACKRDEPRGTRDIVVAPEPAPPAPTPAPTPEVAPTAPQSDAATVRPDPSAKVDLPARPYDAEVLGWSTRSIDGDKVKDASKGKACKINLYKDAGRATVNRAKVDVNRNDKFDEKYTFEPGKITLQRAPADDEQYSETYHWNGTGWVRQK